MEFLDFLAQCEDKAFWQKQKLLCFKGGADYPCLFFVELFGALGAKNILPAACKSMLIGSVEKNKLFASLKQSFLGQENFYWLSAYDFGKTEKGKGELFNFLATYAGPHFVAFYLNDDKMTAQHKAMLKNQTVVRVEGHIDIKTFERIASLLGNGSIRGPKKLFIKKLFKQVDHIFLDKAVLLIKYLELVHAKHLDEFYDYIMSFLVDVSPSLHLLSQHFFAKKPEPFFAVWSQVHKDYSDMFWVSFWAEQFFRAYYFVKFYKEKNFSKARAMSFRLPFMFMKRDWQNFSLNELSNYYQFIYNIDFKLKTGSTLCLFDLFYVSCFSSQDKKRDVRLCP